MTDDRLKKKYESRGKFYFALSLPLCFYYGEGYSRAFVWLVVLFALATFYAQPIKIESIFKEIKNFPLGTIAVILRYVFIPTVLALFLLALNADSEDRHIYFLFLLDLNSNFS